MYEDLKFYITLGVNKTPRSYTGKIIKDTKGVYLQLDRICASLPKDEQDAFQYSKLDYITCNANNGKQYAFYNLKWIETQTNYGKSNIILTFTLIFEDLIEFPTKDKLYNGVLFSFDYIDSIFDKTSFDTHFPNPENENEIKFTLTVPSDLTVTIEENVKVKFFSKFDGLVSSHSLYDLDVKQNKQVIVKYPERISYDLIFSNILILKLYFEYVYNVRMNFRNIELVDDGNNYKTSRLVISNLYNKEINDMTSFKKRYTGRIDDLVSRLSLWYKLYEQFSESILIWKKTIYNQNIDQDDKYLWICQAFESMCQHDQKIYSAALLNAKKKNKKATYPNLSDYLNVVESIINFEFSNRAKYYKTIVKVRDKLTHNNPKKHVTDTEKDESYRLIDYFYLSLVISKLDDIRIGRMISLP